MNKVVNYDALKRFPLFDVLSEEEKMQLEHIAEYKVLPKFSRIYETDAPADKIYFLVRGIVKIGTKSEDNREVIKAILHPIAFFGELGLVGATKRKDFAQVMNKDAHFFTITVSDFRRLMFSNHRLCMNVLSMVGERLRKAEQRLEALIFKDARSRIIDFLKDTAEKRGRKVGYELMFKHCLTQQDIANITGTSRQTVTSVLNELRKDNLIYFNRRSILIRDVERLG